MIPILLAALLLATPPRAEDAKAWRQLVSHPFDLQKAKSILEANPRLDLNHEEAIGVEAQCVDSRTLLAFFPMDAELEGAEDFERTQSLLKLFRGRGASRRNCLTLGRVVRAGKLKLYKGPSASSEARETLAVTEDSAFQVSAEDHGWLEVSALLVKGYDKQNRDVDSQEPAPRKLKGWLSPGSLYWDYFDARRPTTARGKLTIQSCSVRNEEPLVQVQDEAKKVFVIEGPRTPFGCGGG